MQSESFLVVVAHPDDDVLGLGGTGRRLTAAGHRVQAAILCGEVSARGQRPSDGDLRADILRATERLGMAEPILGDFPNIRMNTIPHLDLVQFVERAIEEAGATRLFTLHPSDLNDDHRQVSRAAQAAARIAQRRPELPPLRSLHYMEVQSATDWAFRGDTAFSPDSYIEIGEEGVAAKLEALACYREVMRDFPHPRSAEAITGLAAVRGGESRKRYAEAFQTAYLDLDTLI